MPTTNIANADIGPGLKIDEEGFVTASKGVSLPGLSLGIWVATLIIYRILVAVNLCPKYTTFCFFISLALSVAGSWFAVNKMKVHVTASSKLFLILMNTFVIYTSANGIQAGNSFLSKSEPGDICKEASLIPLLPADPWLPDKQSEATIASQLVVIKQLKDSFDRLTHLYNLLTSSERISGSTLTFLSARNDSLQKQLGDANKRNKSWDSLTNVWANSADRSLDSLLYNIQRHDRPLKRSAKWFVSFLVDSTSGNGFYKELFGQ